AHVSANAQEHPRPAPTRPEARGRGPGHERARTHPRVGRPDRGCWGQSPLTAQARLRSQPSARPAAGGWGAAPLEGEGAGVARGRGCSVTPGWVNGRNIPGRSGAVPVMSEYRIEHDSMGEVRVPVDAKWRAQ